VLKVFFLIVLVFVFLQTPFYTTMVVSQYKKFEAALANLLYSKPEDTRSKRYPATDPSLSPTFIPAPAPVLPDTDMSTFMPKKSPGASRAEVQLPYQKPTR